MYLQKTDMPAGREQAPCIPTTCIFRWWNWRIYSDNLHVFPVTPGTPRWGVAREGEVEAEVSMGDAKGTKTPPNASSFQVRDAHRSPGVAPCVAVEVLALLGLVRGSEKRLVASLAVSFTNACMLAESFLDAPTP